MSISSVQFSHLVVSDSLWPHGLQLARLPCALPTPRACSNSCPSSWWCSPTITSILCHPILLLLSIFPSIRVFSNESVLHIRWSKYLASVLPMNIQRVGSIPGLGRSPRAGNGNPLQYSCLENPMGEEPGRLQSIELQTVEHDWSDLARMQVCVICLFIMFLLTSICMNSPTKV